MKLATNCKAAILGGVSIHALQGVTSNVIGGVISQSISGADQRGWRGIFDISDQWPNALGNAAGQIAHQFLQGGTSYLINYAKIGGDFTKNIITNYANSFMQQGFTNDYPFDITKFANNSSWNTLQGWVMDTKFGDVY
ncbi:MAG TPA: hypothetical protein VGS79_19475 [Puia sp.]|nr:hypothetical protein [Puia sp.]